MQRNNRTNPKIRVLHAHPSLGKRDWSIKGKIIPPKDPPVAASPVALARPSTKKCATAATAGVNRSELPKPARIEKANMNW